MNMYRNYAKRIIDFAGAAVLVCLLSPVLLACYVLVRMKMGSPVLFTQTRIGKGERAFKIYKFRSMTSATDRNGNLLPDVERITKLGVFLRKTSLDELPQLFNVLSGDMSFVGTRPEVPKYVERYTDEMYATLLLPAGITSEASIMYKDEEKLLAEAESADDVYVHKVLPEKMKYNLIALRTSGFYSDFYTMYRTLNAVAGD